MLADGPLEENTIPARGPVQLSRLTSPRRTIQAALRNEEMEHARRAAEQRTVELTINEGYSPGAEGAALPGCLGRIFPPLPEGLEYHFVGRALVLWDARAAIVVDYLPDAILELTE